MEGLPEPAPSHVEIKPGASSSPESSQRPSAPHSIKCVLIPLAEYEQLLLRVAIGPKTAAKMTVEQLWHHLRGNENMKKRTRIRDALAAATTVNMNMRNATQLPIADQERLNENIKKQ